MANRKVVLVRNCKTERGWRRYPVAFSKNGRVRPNFVLVNGLPVEYVTGHYEIRLYQGAKAIHRNVGNDPAAALAARDKEARLLRARDVAHAAGTKIVEEESRLALADRLDKHVQAAEDRGSLEAAESYRRAGQEFLQLTGKVYADEITPEDLTLHQRKLRERGCAERTIHNRHMFVASFLRGCGIALDGFSRPPRYEKTLPEIYTSEEMKAFLGSLQTHYDVALFTLALKLGLREAELMHLEWPDFDLQRKTVLVTSKQQYGHRVRTVKSVRCRCQPTSSTCCSSSGGNILTGWCSQPVRGNRTPRCSDI